MRKLRNIIYKNPILWMLILIVFVLWAIETPFWYDYTNQIYKIIKEAVLAIIVFFFIYLASGKGAISYSNKGMGYAFKKSWYALTIPLVMGLLYLIGLAVLGIPFVDNPIVVIIEFSVFALLVGLFEEGLMRGLFFNALLSKYGNTFSGIMKAMIYSSVLFGFIHVAPDLVTSFPNITLIEVGQMIGKTIQSGLLGFLLSAIYLKNHNLWSIAFIHGLNDLLLMVPLNLFKVSNNLGDYVSSSNGGMNIIIYAVISILSIPFLITAVKIAKGVSLPQPGFFKVCWFPQNVREKKK